MPVGNGRGGEHWKLPDGIRTRVAQSGLVERLDAIKQKHRKICTDKLDRQIGTLGGGNHFIEICLDEADAVWVMLHSGSRGTGNLIGNLCALFTGLTFALFIVLLRKQRDASPAGSVFLGNVLTALAGLPFMFDSLPSPAGWAGLIFLGVFQLGLAYVLYTLAISHVTAMEAVLITLIEPILNPFWVFVLMGEIPAWTSLAGGLVIIGSVTARQLAGVRR